MTKTAIKSIPESVAIFGSKPLPQLYRDYCAAMSKENPDQQPMLAKEFDAIVTKAREEKLTYDKVSITPDTKAELEKLGWAIQVHTPVKGSQKGKANLYLVNDNASVVGAGFLRLQRSRLEETKARMEDNLAAIKLILG